jgi:hypothetical protein
VGVSPLLDYHPNRASRKQWADAHRSPKSLPVNDPFPLARRKTKK